MIIKYFFNQKILVYGISILIFGYSTIIFKTFSSQDFVPLGKLIHFITYSQFYNCSTVCSFVTIKKNTLYLSLYLLFLPRETFELNKKVLKIFFMHFYFFLSFFLGKLANNNVKKINFFILFSIFIIF